MIKIDWGRLRSQHSREGKTEEIGVLDLQKAGLWKRVGAALLDLVLTVVVATGFIWAISAICDYDAVADGLLEYHDEYEARYGIDLDLSPEEYTEEQKEIYEKANAEWRSDAKVQELQVRQFGLVVMMISVGLFLSVFILGFILPLIFKNGQTLGKKLLGLGVMHKTGIRLRAPGLFVRTVLGKYTVEIMVPLLLLLMIYYGMIGVVGTLVVVALGLLQIILFCASGTGALIHDVLAYTVTVELAGQKIFETNEDLLSYKEELHREEAARAGYR